MELLLQKNMKSKFRELFEAEPVIVRSPGRINLIGEHTDYNDGYVLPAAIDKYVTVAVSKRTDDLLVIYSQQFEERFSIRLQNLQPFKGHWSNYVTGVVDQLVKKGLPLTGFDMLVDGDVPLGGGMSSSAAMECAVVFALNELYGFQLSKLCMVMLAQQAEHCFAEVNCGIMDPYASLFGKKGMALKLDCSLPQHQYVPLHLKGYKIVLFNTNVKHSLASTAYNQRREECEAGVKKVQAYEKQVRGMRDITLPMLYQYVSDPIIRKRCKYVIKENARLLAGCNDLQIGDLEAFGTKMHATHLGLRDDYEVSCAELDWLVNEVTGEKGVIGARMMGGGFGGCTINIVADAFIEPLWERIAPAYEKEMGKKLTAYIAETADGAEVVGKGL